VLHSNTLNYSSHADVVNHYLQQQRAVPTVTLDHCNAITQPDRQTLDTVYLMKHSFTPASPARRRRYLWILHQYYYLLSVMTDVNDRHTESRRSTYWGMIKRFNKQTDDTHTLNTGRSTDTQPASTSDYW